VEHLDRRPLTVDDAAALAALLIAAEALDDTDRTYPVDTEAARLRHADLTRDSLALTDGGELVGYLRLNPSPVSDGPTAVLVEGTVHPAHRGRGLGRELLGWGVRRARELYTGPLTLRVNQTERNITLHRLLAASGFTEERRFLAMECPLPHPLPVSPPAGTRLTGYRPELAEPLRLARNSAFADHWGSVPRTAGQWQEQVIGAPAFCPELTCALLDERDRVVAYLLSNVRTDELLWVVNVGTVPQWRGRGAAGALVAHTLIEAHRQGYRAVGLGVDATNPTGAVRLYQRAGFTIRRRSSVHSLDIAAPSPG
jgi:mycothiol synthase